MATGGGVDLLLDDELRTDMASIFATGPSQLRYPSGYLRHGATICLCPSGDRGLPLPTLSLSGFIHSVFTAFF
jgi:hypothetical protein